MGLFFEQAAQPGPPGGVAEAAAVAPQATFKSVRFFIALAIFVALLVGGLMADIRGHFASSTALYGFAGTVFGVVSAFLGSEKSASG